MLAMTARYGGVRGCSWPKSWSSGSSSALVLPSGSLFLTELARSECCSSSVWRTRSKRCGWLHERAHVGHVRVPAQGAWTRYTETLSPMADLCGHTIVTADLSTLDHPRPRSCSIGLTIELCGNDRVTVHFRQFDQHRPSRLRVRYGTGLGKFTAPLSRRVLSGR